MPARKPAKAARRIELPPQESRAPIPPEEVNRREQARHNAILRGGLMRMVLDAVIAEGAPIEIDTETHTITITAVEK